MTIVDLPSPGSFKRWTTHRKATVVIAVREGLLTVEEAKHRYAISQAEFNEWMAAFLEEGAEGLKVNRIQPRRGVYPRR